MMVQTRFSLLCKGETLLPWRFSAGNLSEKWVFWGYGGFSVGGFLSFIVIFGLPLEKSC
jgi:hypothetical protein